MRRMFPVRLEHRYSFRIGATPSGTVCRANLHPSGVNNLDDASEPWIRRSVRKVVKRSNRVFDRYPHKIGRCRASVVLHSFCGSCATRAYTQRDMTSSNADLAGRAWFYKLGTVSQLHPTPEPG